MVGDVYLLFRCVLIRHVGHVGNEMGHVWLDRHGVTDTSVNNFICYHKV